MVYSSSLCARAFGLPVAAPARSSSSYFRTSLTTLESADAKTGLKSFALAVLCAFCSGYELHLCVSIRCNCSLFRPCHLLTPLSSQVSQCPYLDRRLRPCRSLQTAHTKCPEVSICFRPHSSLPMT